MNINLLQSRNVLLNMLKNRGYNTDKYRNFSVNEIRLMNDNDELDMLLEKETGMKCYVKYHIRKKFNSNALNKAVKRHYISDDDDDEIGELSSSNNDELIIICNVNILLSKKSNNSL